MLGQVLYLEAEAAGIRATGIGCFFDDPVHEIVAMKGLSLQSLYHFTIGGPVTTEAIVQSLYEGLQLAVLRSTVPDLRSRSESAPDSLIGSRFVRIAELIAKGATHRCTTRYSTTVRRLNWPNW